MSFEEELNQLVGKKIVSVEGNVVIFGDESTMHLHPYETYIYLADLGGEENDGE